MNIDSLADFFMPEDRKRGEDLFNNDVISISSASDTQALAYVRASGAPRVSFDADDIASSSFQADCTCPVSRKGKFCKHIWATLLKLEENGADFLASKLLVKKAATKPESAASLAAKARQAEYKQQRRDQNRACNKKNRRDKKEASSTVLPIYSHDVEAARAYFFVNGFEFSHPPLAEELASARKILTRVFHPDRGGSHTEMLELNRNYDLLKKA